MTSRPAHRTRQLLRRVAIVLTGVLLALGAVVAWSAIREPPELQRSQAVTLGMSRPEVETIMGTTGCVDYDTTNGEHGRLYGALASQRQHVIGLLVRWTGLDLSGPSIDAWPVHLRFDHNDRVIRIERGGDVEESSR